MNSYIINKKEKMTKKRKKDEKERERAIEKKRNLVLNDSIKCLTIKYT